MNSLCSDIAYTSISHYGEQLCGDHVEIVHQSDSSTVMVLADGLGSGVKASILSTLTAKIIATMISEGLSLEECVSTIAATLPVCSVRGVAYSTFTIIHLHDNTTADLIQYDNPQVILLRNGLNCEYPVQELHIGDMTILSSTISLQENDIFIAMSDGCTHAGMGRVSNFGWQRSDIISTLEKSSPCEHTAKMLSSLLVEECNKLYAEHPRDDTTVAIVRIRKRVPMNVLFGPPSDPQDSERMMREFFSHPGKHIVSGGTTCSIAAEFLGKPLRVSLDFEDDDIPPIAELEGVDIATEGVLTISKVLTYALDYLDKNEFHKYWSIKNDGASQISRLLFEEATDINFYVGCAVNPAHQNPTLPLTFNIKMNLVKELSSCLHKMGKKVAISYF